MAGDVELWIISKHGNYWPKDWDQEWQLNDNDFGDMAEHLKATHEFYVDTYPIDIAFRYDPNELRQAISKTDWTKVSKDRYYKMADILERDNNLYIWWYID